MSADLGAKVLRFEKNEIPGRKLSASGNGRGNVTNRRMELSCYHSEDMERLSALFPSFSSGEALSYLRRLGILFHDRNGYIYPRTDRAQWKFQGNAKERSSCNGRFYDRPGRRGGRAEGEGRR